MRLGQQFGAAYLPAAVMESQQLVEKHLAAAGLRDVHSLRDFTEKDRIAHPSLKVSRQALMLQMVAEQMWGPGNHRKLDHIIVALPHPEAVAAVLNPGHEVNAHFATPPFHEVEMKAGQWRVTSGFDIMGGPTTGVTFTSNDKFRAENPKVFAAVKEASRRRFCGSMPTSGARPGSTFDDKGEETDRGRADRELLGQGHGVPQRPEPGRQAGRFPLPDGIGQGQTPSRGGTCFSRRRMSFRGAEPGEAGGPGMTPGG